MAANPLNSLTPPEGDRVLSVSALTRDIKQLLETNIGSVWLRGEVSNLRRQASGHRYFSLKDEGSQVSAVFFRGHAAQYPVELRDGMQVVVFGEVSVYEARGNYQIIVRAVFEDGMGRLQAQFERLKRKLADEGLFDAQRKKPLPAMPRTVAFVTSPTGAALRDFVSILRRRAWSGRLLVLPARVQGAEAADELVERIADAEKLGGIDLLVLGRGGGSLEDLWPFNEERVARAVAACPIPTISAVGHEIDFALSDFAADRRAETPSAAAELISSAYVGALERIRAAATGMHDSAELFLERRANQLGRHAAAMERLSPERAVERGWQRVDDLSNRLRTVFAEDMAAGKDRLHELRLRLSGVHPENRLRIAAETLAQLGKRLDSASPANVLKRGYAIVRDAKGRPVSSAKNHRPGDALVNEFHDGAIDVTVTPPPPRQEELFGQ